jgi:FMN phosphatase YigB (HAD superfamily)
MFNLFCDLDGVLVNFDNGVFRIIGKYPRDISNVGYLWATINKKKNFWIDLDWMSDGML